MGNNNDIETSYECLNFNCTISLFWCCKMQKKIISFLKNQKFSIDKNIKNRQINLIVNGLTNMNLNCVGLSSNWNFCCQIALPSFLFLFGLWSCFSPSAFKAWEISLSSCCLFSSFIPVTVQGGFEQTTLKLFVLGQWLLQRWLNDRFQH